jgi:hypothetical protein
MMSKPGTEPDGLPSGVGECEHLRGRAIIDFEVERDRPPEPATLIGRLMENSRARWRELQSTFGNRVLWREESPDRFRYSIALYGQPVTSAIDVQRTAPNSLWSHGHILRARRLDCAIHQYDVTTGTDFPRLRERVEIRTTSRVFRLYRHRMVEKAIQAANDQLDEVMEELAPTRPPESAPDFPR